MDGYAITHRDLGKEGKSFRLYLDGKVIKESLVKDGELILHTEKIN